MPMMNLSHLNWMYRTRSFNLPIWIFVTIFHLNWIENVHSFVFGSYNFSIIWMHSVRHYLNFICIEKCANVILHAASKSAMQMHLHTRRFGLVRKYKCSIWKRFISTCVRTQLSHLLEQPVFWFICPFIPISHSTFISMRCDMHEFVWMENFVLSNAQAHALALNLMSK